MAAPLWSLSAVETARRIAAGEVSAEAVTQAHLVRMAAVNPRLNAVVVELSAKALAAARDADARRARGEPLGLLHGVPVTVKINVDVEGEANSNGVPAFKDNIAPGDSAVVANLRRAGAVIIGLTNTPEFSMRLVTDNPLHGLTRNPWSEAVTCGGSSGGAGSSVAMGIGAIAHGNDIGGSLRWPASCNGVATIKPTQGRIPAFNPSAPVERPLMAQFMSSQGPLAREVADVRLGLAAMSARDPRDPWWVPAPLEGPALARPIRVALAKIPPSLRIHPEVAANLRAAADHLADAGYAVEEADVPGLDETWELWRDLIATETATLQMDAMRTHGSEALVRSMDGLLSIANVLDLKGYMEAIAHRSRILRRWMTYLEDRPLILAPVSVRPTPAVDAGFGGEMRFTSAINVLGLPAAVVPAGFAGGVPQGVQLIATRYREDVALEAAAAIEARVGVLAHALWERETATA